MTVIQIVESNTLIQTSDDITTIIEVTDNLDRTLGALLDVDITNVQDNDLLVYNSVTSKWENGSISGVQETLADVSSFSTTTVESLYGMTSGVNVEFQTAGGNPLLYLDEANRRVGVNTSTPLSDFQIDAPSGLATLRFHVGSQSGYSEIAGDSGSGLIFYTYDAGIFERMRIDKLGNVGIGTDAPDAELEVVGTVLSERMDVVTTSSSALINIYNPGTGSENSYLQWLDSSGTLDYRMGQDLEGGDLIIYNGNLLATHVLFRTSGVTYFPLGAVGIGVASPAEELHIRDTSSSGPVGMRLENSEGHVNLYTDGGGFRLDTDTTSNVFNIDLNGDVGIGNSSPDQRLHVEGSGDTYSLKRTSGASANVFSTYENSGDASDAWATGRHNAGDYYILHSTGSTYPSGTTSVYFVIDTDGNVGLGNSSPEYILDIRSDSPVLRLADDNVSNVENAAAIWLGENAQLEARGAGFHYDGLANKFYLKTSDDGAVITSPFDAVARITIQETDGFVGVGTTSPDSLFHVAGNAQLGDNDDANDANTVFRIYSGERTVTNGESTIISYAAHTSGSTWGRTALVTTAPTAGDGVLTFQTTKTNVLVDRLTIDEDGLVGVGDISPAYLLDVDGEIGARELSADPADPAEGRYVFWMSDGTGTGEDGDIIFKSTAASSTSTFYLREESIVVAASDESTDLTTGTAKISIPIPFDMIVTEVFANVNTAPTGSAISVDINEDGVSILSTVITIDAGETSSLTAATPPVISDNSLTKGNVLSVDIDAIGSTVAGTGLKVVVSGYRN